jgi:hypothetical protein
MVIVTMVIGCPSLDWIKGGHSWRIIPHHASKAIRNHHVIIVFIPPIYGTKNGMVDPIALPQLITFFSYNP